VPQEAEEVSIKVLVEQVVQAAVEQELEDQEILQMQTDKLHSQQALAAVEQDILIMVMVVLVPQV
jgi:hypothetical protein